MSTQLKAYFALLYICIIWGTTYLALRVGVLSFPPFLFSAIRQVGAGLILLVAMWFIDRTAFPDRKQVLRQIIPGFLTVTMGNGLVAYAEMYIPSGVAALICSTMPVAVVLLNLAIFRTERINSWIFSGLALGVIGILLVFRENIADLANPQYSSGVALCFLAIFCWAGGAIYTKRNPQSSNPFYNAAFQLMFGGAFMLVFSAFFDDYARIASFNHDTLYALSYLTIFGSVGAYAAYFYCLKNLPVGLVSVYAYINPMVAVLLGWMVLHEKLNFTIGVAFVLTILGVGLVNRGYRKDTAG
jgi:drug/metabolite transporter (DMT)-like permease